MSVFFFTTFHRSMASTQTLMKASRASARLEFSVLSVRGQLHVMGKSCSYAKQKMPFFNISPVDSHFGEKANRTMLVGTLYNIFVKAQSEQHKACEVFFATSISNNLSLIHI